MDGWFVPHVNFVQLTFNAFTMYTFQLCMLCVGYVYCAYCFVYRSLHPRKKIAKIMKMASSSKATQLHCIYKPSLCVHINAQLQAEIVCYKPTRLVLPCYVDMLTHYLDVKIHIVQCSKSAFNL